MLDAFLHQGSGLRAHAAQSAPRIVAMASHGDRQSELPLLSDLCTAWTDLGYLVVVLDATVAESDNLPGLQQMLGSSGQTHTADAIQAIWPASLTRAFWGSGTQSPRLYCREIGVPSNHNSSWLRP